MPCPLCLEDKELVTSHLIPQAIYDYCRTAESEPVIMTSRIVMQTSRQVQHALLCQKCEDVLNKGGENWLLPLLATIDKKFPLLDIIERFEPDEVDGELRTYAAARNPAIEVHKLIHFAMGVFWKASIHSWEAGSKAPRIELGPYRESIRTFLRGETPFPQTMGLVLGVLPREQVPVGFSLPYRNPEREFPGFTFHIPGIVFALSVGKRLGPNMPRICFAANPAHPILVADLSKDITSVGAAIFGKARKSKRLHPHQTGLPRQNLRLRDRATQWAHASDQYHEVADLQFRHHFQTRGQT